MRLIDAGVLYEKTAEWEAVALHMVEKTMNDEDTTEWKRWSTILTERSAFKFDVADAPTVDAVPVVRCCECKKCATDECCFFARGEWGMSGPDWNFYCADGEREGGDE